MPVMRSCRLLGAALALASVGLVGCGQDPAKFQLVFPSQETFLLSSNGTVTVYDPEEDSGADAICRNLSAGLPAGQESEASTGSRDVCQLDNVALNDVPVGRVVFFADIVGGPDRVSILKGCTVADVFYDTTEPVVIQLSTLPTYPDNYDLKCSSKEAKCEQNETCL